MSRRYYANSAPTQTLGSSITSGATTLTVAGSFVGWPAQFPFFATLDLNNAGEEIISVTGVSGTTATVVRGQDGTSAVSHPAGVTLDQTIVRQDFDEANAHTSATAGVHGISGSVVGTSDSQTVSNKTLSSNTLGNNTVSGTLTGGTYSAPTVTAPAVSNATITGDATHPALVGKATTAGGKTLSLRDSTNTERIGADDAGNLTAVTLTTSGALAAASATVAGGAGGLLPPGALVPFAGTTAPTGYLKCDGSAVSRTTYAALFGVLGATYGGGDGSTTFNLPDMRGRAAVGVDGTTEFAALNTKGGEKTHVLSTTEMPAHTHNVDAFSLGQMTATQSTNADTGTATNRYMLTGTLGAAYLYADSQGGGLAHNNLQPYVSLNFIIKT